MTKLKTIPTAPLAEELRPTSLAEIIGQSHLLGVGKPLRLIFESGQPQSMIFWGPPGVGKTTLARLAAQAFDAHWISLSAVMAGVKEIRAAVESAQQYRALGRRTILFVDEIHRFNKAQQDALLPYTEAGILTLIGATTENPSFALNNALLSRAHVYVLQALTETELKSLFTRVHNEKLAHLQFSVQAQETLIQHADGDARRLLNLLEHVQQVSHSLKHSQIDEDIVASVLATGLRRFDKDGDHFYDQISALHKAVRGSHPDAALYWLCRMLDGGVDPTYLARRIVRMAWEDVGLADPRAMQIANEAAQTYERLGSPEGELALAQAIIYLAVAAKSNAGYKAYNEARAFVARDKSRSVPLHLCNAPTGLMQQLGYSQGYRYAHDEKHGYAAGMSYLPDGMIKPQWYQPVARGMEQKIADKLAFLQSLDKQAHANADSHEN